MKRLLILLLLLSSGLRAQTSKELLADGLFAEEAEGDLKMAAEKYEALLKAYEDERKIAATALYRLAEIRGKEDDQAGVVRILKKLLMEFPGVHPQGRLATEKLEALGEDLPATGEGIASPELKAIEELNQLAATSPDLRVREMEVVEAASLGWSRYLQYLFEAQGLAALKGGLKAAVSSGNLEITKQLVEAGIDPNSEEAFGIAVERGFEAVIINLVEKGADLSKSNPSFLLDQLSGGEDGKVSRLRKGIALGAQINVVSRTRSDKDQWHWLRKSYFTPLLEAVRQENQEIVALLLENGANPNLVEFEGDISALHLAVYQNSPEIVKALLMAGADPKYKTTTPENVGVPAPGSIGVPPVKADPIPVLTSRVTNPDVVLPLLEAGAKVPEKALLIAAEAGSLELVKAYLEKGANIEEFNGEAERTPLLVALAMRHDKIVDFLRSKGAKVYDSHWKFLSGKRALEWNRELNYSEWAKGELVTFVLPEFPIAKNSEAGALRGQLKPGPGIYQEMLKLFYPTDFQDDQNQNHSVDLDTLDWNLIRKGVSTDLDFSKGPFPDLKPGDIVEAVGVSQGDSRLGMTNVTSLESFSGTQILNAILPRIKVPFTLKIGETEHALEMRGDSLVYDPRTKIVPYFKTLDDLMTMIGIKWVKEINVGRSIVVRHKETPGFRLPVGVNVPFYPKHGDVIEIVEAALGGVSVNESAFLERRLDHVSVIVPARLGGWHWIPDGIGGLPSLLQALSMINEGYDFPENAEIDDPSSWDFELLSDPGIAPAIDFSQIRLRRLNEAGEEEVMEIDLAEEIRQWDAAGREEKPYDLGLLKGDIVELVLKDGDWTGLSEPEKEFLRRALLINIGVQDGGGTIQLQKLEYGSPRWVKSARGLLPMGGTVNGIWRPDSRKAGGSDPFSENSSSIKIIRDGKTIHLGTWFFLREGDIVEKGNFESQGTHFVPRPKK